MIPWWTNRCYHGWQLAIYFFVQQIMIASNQCNINSHHSRLYQFNTQQKKERFMNFHTIHSMMIMMMAKKSSKFSISNKPKNMQRERERENCWINYWLKIDDNWLKRDAAPLFFISKQYFLVKQHTPYLCTCTTHWCLNSIKTFHLFIQTTTTLKCPIFGQKQKVNEKWKKQRKKDTWRLRLYMVCLETRK